MYLFGAKHLHLLDDTEIPQKHAFWTVINCAQPSTIWSCPANGAGINKEVLTPSYCLWPIFAAVLSRGDSSCGWVEFQGNLSAIECVMTNSHTSLPGDSVAFVYGCRCEYVRASLFPESWLTALNICGVLWDNPDISFTHDKDTSYNVRPLFHALISQGIVQFMGKMDIKDHGCLL